MDSTSGDNHKKRDVEERGSKTPEASGVDTASAMSKTTTISTIAVQSGKTRIVIALLHCGDWLDLKVLEITPDLASLGNTLEEALDLQRAHDEVLRQLQNKQSPVEELLRQADHLISTQKPRAEVYAAMAESLGRAWKDINLHLEFRKQILDLNVQYHTFAREFFTKVEELEAACKDTVVPIDIDAVKRFLTDIHEIRRALLEAHMNALQAGNSLIAKLKELGAKGTLDSRPDRIRTTVNRAISQVQEWMDELHNKRQILETIFVKRKAQLEQCLALAILAVDLKEVEDAVNKGREALANSDELGDSSASAELLLQWHRKLLPEANQLQERALKITKATEQLEASGCFASEQAKDQAYKILSTTSDYLNEITEHNALLEKVINFFRTAHTVFTKLDQLEIQLQTTELPSTSPQLAKFHAQCAETIENLTGPSIELGFNILREAKHGRGTEGVRKTVEELENRKITLENLCTAHREDKLRINRALNEFLEKHEELYSWLKSIAEAFLQGHQDMGSDFVLAKDFLDLHNQLLNDLQTKGNEINSLLLTLPPILEYLDDEQRRDVDSRVESLHDHWVKLKNILEKRLDLASIYVKFHNEANLANEKIDKLEELLRANADNMDFDVFKTMEEEWEEILPLYQSAKNTGITFINETKKQRSEPHLDTKRACVCVESVLEKLSNRQVSVTRSWQTFKTDVEERREVHLQWEETIMQCSKTLGWVTKLDSQLYPLINISSNNPSDIINHLERRQETVLPEIKKAQNEVEQRIKMIETLIAKSSQRDDQSLNMKNKLIELNQKLIEITSEYQILLQILTGFFKNISELDKTTENLNSQFGKAGLPKNVADVEMLIREHEASRQAVLEMFRFTQNECEQLKSRIIQQEPRSAAQNDISKLDTILEIRKIKWEEEWKKRRESLESQKKLSHFNSEYQNIDENINELSRQLSGIKEQCRESQATTKSVAQTFYHFTKVTETLDIRVKNLVKEGENIIRENHMQSPQIEFNINQIQEKWSKLKSEVNNISQLIEISNKYYEIVNEADQWLKDGSRILVSVAKRTSAIKKTEEAQQLLKEVENFIKPGETRQTERIEKISQLSKDLFSPGWSKEETEIKLQHKEIIESFNSIINELNTLSQNLKLSEEQQERFKREQEEANANLAAARAEAEKAKQAAKAAEDEKRAAEEAKKIAEEGKKAAEEAKLIAESTVKSLQERVTSQIVNEIEIPKPAAAAPPVFVSTLSDVIIQEGAKFTFMCNVTGTPTPTVTWYKDGISIQNNPDYQTSFEHGLCALTIEETFAEDSARYTCKATNSAGSAETTAFLAVKEQQQDEQLIPPTFVKLLQPGYAKEGGKFQFECTVQGYPLPTVQWFKGNDCIDNSPDYSITYNNGEAVLKFEKVTLSDKADYTCKATNKLGVAQSKCNLNVEPEQPTVAPYFKVPLSNVMARAGQKLKLECEVIGVPAPNLSWTQNGKVVKESRDLKLAREGETATLVISEAFPKDAGTFAVIATNSAGEATSTCNVTVKGRLPTETSDSEIASDMEPIKPSIQVPLKDISIFEGQKVRLDCVIVGQPEPEVIWYRDDVPVKESSDFQLLFQGDRCSLIIQEAFSEDAGEYKVVALNSAGEASSKCRLIVTPLTDKQPAPKPSYEETEIAGSPPKFSKLLSDVLVSENERVIFEATVSGQPRPEIIWLLNNKEITADNRVITTYDVHGNVSLRIDQVQPDDRGVYTVKAQNSLGEAKCFAQLIVKTSKPVELRKPFEDLKSPPFFSERFTDKIATEETSTKFECIVTGKPTPKVRWFFNDAPVSGKDFLVSTSGDRQILTVSNITKKSEGKITCIAENEAGTSSWSAKLIVRPAMELAQYYEKPSTELKRHVESSYILKQEMQVESSSTVKKISSENESDIQTHSIKSHDHKSITQTNEDKPKIVETHKVEEYRSFGDQPSISHERSVSSLTTDYKKEHEQSLTSQKKVIKSRPPKFINPIMGKIVDQNTRVVLEGIIDGQPTPTISWTKNGEELKESDNVKITHQFGKTSVEILNTSASDSGRYTCTAINEAGSAVSTSDLVVKKTIFPPVFGRRLQAQVVKKGERTRMEVEVTGTPEPTVTWYKDGVLLTSEPREGRKIKREGNCHTLIIEKAEMKDQGKYMVRAVNEGGEAQSIADFAVYEPTPDTMMEVVKTVVFEDVRKHEILSSTEDKIKSMSSTEQKIPLSIKSYDSRSYSLPEVDKSVVTKKEIIKSTTPVSFNEKSSSQSHYHSSESKKYQSSESKSESKSQSFTRIESGQPISIQKNIDNATFVVPDVEKSAVSKTEIFKTNSVRAPTTQGVNLLSSGNFHDKETLVTPNTFSSIDSARYILPDGEKSVISKTEIYRSNTPYGTEEKKVFQTSSSSFSQSQSSKSEKLHQSDFKTNQTSSIPTIQKSIFTESENIKQQPSYQSVPTSFQQSSSSQFSSSDHSFVKEHKQTPSTVSVIDNASYSFNVPEIQRSVTSRTERIESRSPLPTKNETFSSEIKSSESKMYSQYQQSSMHEKQTSTESKKIILDHVTPDLPRIPQIPKPLTRDFPITQKEIVIKTEKQEVDGSPVTSEMKKESFIGTGSFETSSKQSSIDFSVKKIYKNEDSEIKKEIQQTAITPGVYKKYEEISKPVSEKTFQSSNFQKETKHLATEYPTITSETKIEEQIKLKPESPPEICFAPSTQTHEGTFLKQYEKVFHEEIPSTDVSYDTKSVSTTRKHFQELSKLDEKKEIQKIVPTKIGMESTVHKSWSQQKESEVPPVISTSYLYTVEKQTSGPCPLSSMSASSQEHTFEKSHDEKSYSTQSTLEKRWAPVEPKFERHSEKIEEISTSKPINYIAEVTGLHQHQFKTDSFQESTLSESKYVKDETLSQKKKELKEEVNLKPSQFKKVWPPMSTEDRSTVSKTVISSSSSVTPSVHSLTVRPVSVQDITDEVYLEPGPPPEIGYAPPVQRRQSYVELIEQDLEKNLEKEPLKVPTGAVRTIPPPLPPKNEYQQAPPLPAKSIKITETSKKDMKDIESKTIERFPDLEPFPYTAGPEKPKPMKVGPPPTPSKFVKGKFTDSDYESDIESARIPAKWKPASSDTEEPSYRKVRPPTTSPSFRSRSVEPEPLPPSKFDNPPETTAPPRPVIDFRKTIKKDTSERKFARHSFPKAQESSVQSEQILKPGSPPIYLEAPPLRQKPDSPKVKHKPAIDGYMADTDEPRTLIKKTFKEDINKTEHKQIQSGSTFQKSYEETKISHTAPRTYKKHVSSSYSSSKKELVPTPIVTNISTTETVTEKQDRSETLESYNVQTEIQKPMKIRGPPAPSPSKFVKGEFRESDYESDFEGRKIPPLWTPQNTQVEKTYKPVRPILTPTGRQSQTSAGRRTPTPPTEFDNPPQISGPPRPKFEPIEKPLSSVKFDKFAKREETKQIVHKPKAVSAKANNITDIIIATPAVPKSDIILQPGSPPEMGFAPGPKAKQYYKSTTTTPYHNAVQTETSNVMHFKEATENSQRTVSLQQTRKVITFGSQDSSSSSQHISEKRRSAPPPTRPKKFIPGDFRESDYESEVDGAKIRPLWAPYESDSEEPRYKKVKAPQPTRSMSLPRTQDEIMSSSESRSYSNNISESKHYDYQKTTKEESSFMESSKKLEDSKEIVSKSAYTPKKIAKSEATHLASKHMEDMTHSFKSKTQNFVSDIMSDLSKKTSTTDKVNGDMDAQVYREENRAAQYGTKHVDPDTGLIYFKYDFGYEFGIILPGEGKSGEIPVPKKTIIEPPKRNSDIQMPVYHETTKNQTTPNKNLSVPNKTVRWEPTSESEMSEYESEGKKKFGGNKWDQSSASPYSLSPSIPSTSPAFNQYGRGQETPTSTPGNITPGDVIGTHFPKKEVPPQRAPLFITPLRDIAAVKGQPARFECIVQSEGTPTVLWSKDGRILTNSANHQIFFRNGVCRLTIPQAFPDDAGVYSCTATNPVGVVSTSATLQVPGERRSQYM